MVLVTSGTISVAITSSIIGLFTFLLFLSGYQLQQQSVRNIQAALPKYTAPARATTFVPVTPEEPPQRLNDQKAVLEKKDYQDVAEEDEILNTLPAPKAEKQDPIFSMRPQLSNRHAYVQVLSKPSTADVCSALLFCTTLALNGSSPAEHIVIYPKSWDTNSPTANLAAALRTLRLAAKTYNLTVHSIDMDDPRHRYPSTIRLFRRAFVHMKDYDRILSLRTPGVVGDIRNLENLMQLSDSTGTLPEDESSLSWSRRMLDKYQNYRRRMWVDAEILNLIDLPPVVLTTTRYLRPGMQTRRSQTLRSSVQRNYVNSVMGTLKSFEENAHQSEPGYVYFEKNKNVLQERRSVYYLDWRKGVESVCQGIDTSD